MILTSNIERLGYYSVGSQEFLFKTDALVAANNNIDQVVFNFNNNIFNRVNCTKDPVPNTTLKELYKQRAQQIRDEYDYVVVMFSGGPDSTNVLKSFADNNIKIDEIVNMNSYAATGIVEGTIDNADYVYNVKPVLEKLLTEKNLNTRITILDAVDVLKQHGQYHMQQDSHELLWNIGGPNQIIVRTQWIRYVPHIWAKVQNGEKVAIVNGADKPSLKLVNGKYGFYFHDLGLEVRDPEIRNLDIFEPFYWSAKSPFIVLKQAHILKNFMDANPGAEYYETPVGRAAFNCPGRYNQGNLKYNLYHLLIYPDWDPAIVTPKPTNGINRPTDCWWFEQFRDNDQKVWSHSMKDFWKKYKPLIVATTGYLSGIPIRPSAVTLIE